MNKQSKKSHYKHPIFNVKSLLLVGLLSMSLTAIQADELNAFEQPASNSGDSSSKTGLVAAAGGAVGVGSLALLNANNNHPGPTCDDPTQCQGGDGGGGHSVATRVGTVKAVLNPITNTVYLIQDRYYRELSFNGDAISVGPRTGIFNLLKDLKHDSEHDQVIDSISNSADNKYLFLFTSDRKEINAQGVVDSARPIDYYQWKKNLPLSGQKQIYLSDAKLDLGTDDPHKYQLAQNYFWDPRSVIFAGSEGQRVIINREDGQFQSQPKSDWAEKIGDDDVATHFAKLLGASCGDTAKPCPVLTTAFSTVDQEKKSDKAYLFYNDQYLIYDIKDNKVYKQGAVKDLMKDGNVPVNSLDDLFIDISDKALTAGGTVNNVSNGSNKDLSAPFSLGDDGVRIQMDKEKENCVDVSNETPRNWNEIRVQVMNNQGSHAFALQKVAAFTKKTYCLNEGAPITTFKDYDFRMVPSTAGAYFNAPVKGFAKSSAGDFTVEQRQTIVQALRNIKFVLNNQNPEFRSQVLEKVSDSKRVDIDIAAIRVHYPKKPLVFEMSADDKVNVKVKHGETHVMIPVADVSDLSTGKLQQDVIEAIAKSITHVEDVVNAEDIPVIGEVTAQIISKDYSDKILTAKPDAIWE